MKRQSFLPYVTIIIFIIFLTNLSRNTTDKIRSFAISSVVPLKVGSKNIKSKSAILTHDFEKILLENELLKSQADGFYEYLTFEQKIEEQIETLKKITDQDEIQLNDYARRRADEIKDILKIDLQAIPAKVIYRDSSSWSSSFWINIGERQNASLGKNIISKNSPVVIGKNLVGVVEYVGYSNSRVRLITDSGLVPSVRAIRGSIQDRSLFNVVKSLKDQIYVRDELFEDNEKKDFFLNELFQLSQKLSQKNEDKYLAKGELHGSSQPFFRSKGIELKGIGFNYDYPEEENSKDNKVISTLAIRSDPLLKVGDLLITTGMDGVFPPGLHVANVTKIEDLKDGDFSYEINAKPTVTNINELEFVFVLPSLEFEKI